MAKEPISALSAILGIIVLLFSIVYIAFMVNFGHGGLAAAVVLWWMFAIVARLLRE